MNNYLQLFSQEEHTPPSVIAFPEFVICGALLLTGQLEEEHENLTQNHNSSESTSNSVSSQKKTRNRRDLHLKGGISRHVFSDILLKFANLFFLKVTKKTKGEAENYELSQAFEDGRFGEEIISNPGSAFKIRINMREEQNKKLKDGSRANEIMKMLAQIRKVFNDSLQTKRKIERLFQSKIDASIRRQEKEKERIPQDRQEREKCIDNLRWVKEMVQTFLLGESCQAWDFIEKFHKRNQEDHEGGTRVVQVKKTETARKNIPMVLGQDWFDVIDQSALMKGAKNIKHSDCQKSNLRPSVQ